MLISKYKSVNGMWALRITLPFLRPLVTSGWVQAEAAKGARSDWAGEVAGGRGPQGRIKLRAPVPRRRGRHG